LLSVFCCPSCVVLPAMMQQRRGTILRKNSRRWQGCGTRRDLHRCGNGRNRNVLPRQRGKTQSVAVRDQALRINVVKLDGREKAVMIPNSYLLVPPHSLGEPHGKSSFPVHTALRRHGVTDIGMSIHGELLAPIERIPKTCSSSACHSYSLSVAHSAVFSTA